MPEIKIKNIKDISIEILKKNGVPEKEAVIISNTIVDAHRKEKHTHGLNRLPIYVRKINDGLMRAKTELNIIRESPLITVIDAQDGFGQVAADNGTDICINCAKEKGIGVVGIKNSNNFGTAGYFGEKIAKSGMIGIVMGNSAPAIAPTGGEKPVMGTNPICFSFPSKEEKMPIVLDMANTVVARGKIRLALKEGETIPLGWAIDKNGKETEDPQEALEGALIPIGGYKGFGLAIVVDILAGLLTGSAFAGEVKNLNHKTDFSRYGHFILAMNPNYFIDKDEYEKRMEILVDNIKACGSKKDIYMPGEKAYMTSCKNKETVQLKDYLVKDINKLAERCDVNIRL